MARDFYPFVEGSAKKDGATELPEGETMQVTHPARIAVYDDAAAAPRVVVVEPKDVRSYLEEITATVNKLSHEQGGMIPFMVVREIVENFVHAYFQAPTVTILDGGNTIRFSDQGPGIGEKDLALEYGTSSATEEMRRYIRGVGSGLPYAQQYMVDKGGSLTIEDNIQGGTVVTISIHPELQARDIAHSQAGWGQQMGASPQMAGGAPGAPLGTQPGMQAMPAQMGQPGYAPAQQGWGQPAQQMPAWGRQAQQPWQQMPAQQPYFPQQAQQFAAPGAGPQPWQQASAQPPAQPDPARVDGAVAGGAAQMPAMPQIGERGRMVLSFLAQNGSCGPTDLARAFGSSAPTWSRELASLAAEGFIMKNGQKYALTGFGRQFAM